MQGSLGPGESEVPMLLRGCSKKQWRGHVRGAIETVESVGGDSKWDEITQIGPKSLHRGGKRRENEGLGFSSRL